MILILIFCAALQQTCSIPTSDSTEQEELIAIDKNYAIHISNLNSTTYFCVSFYSGNSQHRTTDDNQRQEKIGSLCWTAKTNLTQYYFDGKGKENRYNSWYFTYFIPPPLIWTLDTVSDAAYVNVYCSGTLVKSLTLKGSMRNIGNGTQYVSIENNGRENIVVFQQSESCAANQDYDPRGRKCVDCNQVEDRGATQKTTKCMTYGFRVISLSCYLQYNPEFPLHLRGDITSLDMDDINKWFYCLRFYSASYRLMSAFCYNLLQTQRDLRMWRYYNNKWSYKGDLLLPFPEGYGNVTYITLDVNKTHYNIYMNLERQRRMVYSMKLDGSALKQPLESRYLKPSSAYLGQGVFQQTEPCPYGTEYNPMRLQCTPCPNTYHRNNKTGNICQKCPGGTYALLGYADCLPCSCPEGRTCNVDRNDPTSCHVSQEPFKINTLYPFNYTCFLNLYENYRGNSLFNSLRFFDKNKKRIGYVYWDYKQYSWFNHGRDVYGTFIQHSSVSKAIMHSTNYTRQNSIKVDFTDKRTMRFTINGVPVYRVILNKNPRFVNYESVKYIGTSYDRRDTYENWGECGGRVEKCADVSDSCSETVGDHYCRSPYAVTKCAKYCDLCPRQFEYFRQASYSRRVQFNAPGRQTLLRLKDRNLVEEQDPIVFNYYRWTCVSFYDSAGEQLAQLSWNHYTKMIKLILFSGSMKELALPSDLKMTDGEYYIWDISVIRSDRNVLRVVCQGRVIYEFPLLELTDKELSWVSQKYGDLEFQTVYIDMSINLGNSTSNMVVMSGNEATLTCQSKTSTKAMHIKDVSWYVDGNPAMETEGYVESNHSNGLSTLTLKSRMGKWKVSCLFHILGEVENVTTTYSKDTTLTVSGCGPMDDCVEINDCKISTSRVCDKRFDCKSGLDEAVCQTPFNSSNDEIYSSPQDESKVSRSKGIDEICEEGTALGNNMTLLEVCYNRARYSKDLYQNVLKVHQRSFLAPCIPGIVKEEGNCTLLDLEFKFGMKEEWLLSSNLANIHDQNLCENVFGNAYIFLASQGLCHSLQDDMKRDYRDKTLHCTNFNDVITMKMELNNKTVIRRLYNHNMNSNPVRNYSSNYFQCGDGKCIPFSKVCNLVRDCSEGEDERRCESQFRCPGGRNKTIPMQRKCNGVVDCEGATDECAAECYQYGVNKIRILPTNLIRFLVWAMGIIGLLLNCFLMFEFFSQLGKVDNFVGFFNKAFASMIAFGDAIVALYLIAIAVVDKMYADSYCKQRPQWISSNFCKALGSQSTFGLQISLFSMTILSIFRAHTLRSLFKSRKLSNEHKSEVRTAVMIMLTILLAFSLLPNFVFRDYFQYAVFYKNHTLFPGITYKKDHIDAIKFIKSNDENSWSWSAMETLLVFNFGIGSSVTAKDIGFYGVNDICYFNYFVQYEKEGVMDYDFILFPYSVLLANACCFVINVICYVIIFRATRRDSCMEKENKVLKQKDNVLHLKIACIVCFDSLIWLTFIVLCLLHNQRAVDLSQYSKSLCICILPLASVVNPIIFNGNMFFAKPNKLTPRQIGLWVTVLVGLGMALGLELQ